MRQQWRPDSQPGALRDRVVKLISRWRTETAGADTLAIDAGELRGDTDAGQLAFEIFGIALVLHQDLRLLDPKQARKQAERAVEGLIAANSP